MEILAYTNLIAPQSPKKAFYRIWIAKQDEGGFLVQKESGASGKVLDRRSWACKGEKTAWAFYERKVREKTNRKRKSSRIYQPAL